MATPTTVNLNPVYRGRVRTGCLTCRSAKVRCDEERPICKRCMRLEKSCVYKLKSVQPDISSVSTPDRQTDVGPPPEGNPNKAPLRPEPTEQAPCSPSLAHSNGLATPNSTAAATPLLQSRMVSQDIYLCTTIDLIAANSLPTQQHSVKYFIQKVDFPLITPCDSTNWQLFKEHVAHHSTTRPELAAAIYAVQSVYKSQINGLAVSHALLRYYEAALELFYKAVEQGSGRQPVNVLLAAAFLLTLVQCCAPELIENGPFKDAHVDGFQRQILAWRTADMSILDKRLLAWLLILHASARRGGNQGILSTDLMAFCAKICEDGAHSPLVLQDARVPVPLSVSILANLSAPLFQFCLQLQILAGQTANLSHYHRSRVTSDDQDEVASILGDVEEQMLRMWETRPTHLRSKPAEVRALLAPAIAEPLLLYAAICITMYHTEFVELGRILSDPPFASDTARYHMKQMRSIIEDPEWPTTKTDDKDDGRPHVGFLRPLFLYAIESIHQGETDWAVAQMRRIKDPIHRSDFFASFAEGLSQAQREKRRRVTTRWFCLEIFETAPPYL